MMDALKEYLEYGIAAVSIAALVYVVRLFTTFLSNHMSAVTKTLQALVDSSTEIKDAMRDLKDEVRRRRP